MRRSTLFAVLLSGFALALFGALNCSPLEKLPDGGGGGGGDAGKDGGKDAGPDGGGGDAGVGLALAKVCSTQGVAGARCSLYVRCGLIDPSANSACLTYFANTWCGEKRWSVFVNAGTLSYDGLAAQRCADALNASSCAQWDTLPLDCQRILGPNLISGQKCYDQYPECKDGVCRGSNCVFSCQPRGAENEECAFDSDCKPLLYCRLLAGQNGTGVCTVYGQTGASCANDHRCATGLYCDNQQICEAQRQPPLACVSGSCIAGSWCQQTQDGGFCAWQSDAGSACTDDVQCGNGSYCELLMDGGQCASAGPLPDGSACSERQTCVNGDVCVGASATTLGRCAQPIPDGGPCSSSGDCLSYLACNGGQCLPRIANGGTCSADRDCQVFSRCAQGKCVALPTTGSPCLSGECFFGVCIPSDAGPVCDDLGGPDTPCSADIQCVSQRCLNGKCTSACSP